MKIKKIVLLGILCPACCIGNPFASDRTHSQDKSFELGIYALYLRGMVDSGLAYFGVINTGTANNQNLTYNNLTFQNDLGFKVEARKYFCDDFDINLSWVESNNEAKSDNFINIPDLVRLPLIFKYKRRNINVDFGHSFSPSNFTTIRLNAGIEYAMLRAKGLAVEERIIPRTHRELSQFQGVGLNLGATASYELFSNSSFYANINTSMLAGRSKGQHSADVSNGFLDPFDSRNSKHHIVTKIEAKLGFAYNIMSFKLDGGWMFSQYMEALASPGFQGTSAGSGILLKSGLYHHGPYLGARWPK